MTDVRTVAIVGGAAVAIIAMLTGNDGAAIAAFFGLLAGLGLGRMQRPPELVKEFLALGTRYVALEEKKASRATP